MHGKKYIVTIFVLIIFIVSLFFYLLTIESCEVKAQSPDAIAIRVIPNPEHYSAIRWYQEQGFTGSPQSITIDDYEAIRDGRSVYVNAANIEGTDLHTNIYLISYNQDAEQQTLDIFGQILSHWRFNTNISGTDFCSESGGISCLLDSDCPLGEHCQSLKARIIRDTRRLADLTDIRIELESYFLDNEHFPVVPSGSYLAHNSLSVWPSWQKILGTVLSYSLPIDPINKLGICLGYNPITCWNEQTAQFADSIPANGIIDLPTDSLAYVYAASPDGLSYDLYAIGESPYFVSGSAGSDLVTPTVVMPNRSPRFINSSLRGDANEEYSGFVEVIDPDGDPLTWTYNSSGANWASWAGSVAPIMQDMPDVYQKGFFSSRAGAVGTYNFNLTVDDGLGGVASQVFSIVLIDNSPPVITRITGSGTTHYDTGAGLTAHFTIPITIGHPVDLTVEAMEPGSDYPLYFNFNNIPAGFNSSGVLDANQHDFHVSGDVTGNIGDYEASLTATDIYGGESTPVYFRVTVANNPPNITSGPPGGATGCFPYSYRLQATDPDGHTLEYLASGLPAGLSIDPVTGLISGQPLVPAGSFPVTITVRDQYYIFTNPVTNAQTIQNFTFNVVDEAYTITAPPDDDFYVAPPEISTTDLYLIPYQYFNTLAKSTPNNVTYSLATTPSSLNYGATITVHPALGQIYAQATDNSVPGGGYAFNSTITAVTEYCEAVATDFFQLTLYPNGWCHDGTIQPAFEDCEYVGGTGTGPDDQWQCDECAWAGGWCGDGDCNLANEASYFCPEDCGPVQSNYTICTNSFNQPFCNSAASGDNAMITWMFTPTSIEYCDCNGTPPMDCPYGIPCLPSEQVSYYLQVDDDINFLSPEVDTGEIVGNSQYHYVTSFTLSADTFYYYRLRVLDSYGTWSEWAQCTGDCTGDCGSISPESDFLICTDTVNQPVCYTSASNVYPTVYWIFTSIANEYCDCDGTPSMDCPYGSACVASTQLNYYVQIDNNSDFSSPEIDTGTVLSSNQSHAVATSGLSPNVSYYFRVMVQDSYGTWSDWAYSTGPFMTNSLCP